MSQRRLFSFCVLVLSFSSTLYASAKGTVMNWSVDGEKREALVLAPTPTTVPVKSPVVFAFHGHGGNMNGAAQLMHLETL